LIKKHQILKKFFYKKNKKAEEVGASAKRVARPEGPMRATPRGQRGREASDAKIENKNVLENNYDDDY